MLKIWKYQIFRFWSKFVSLTQLSRQQIQFSKLNIWQNILTQQIRKINWVDPEENVSKADGQTDGQMNTTDFIGP